MISKKNIAHIILLLAFVYIIAPWFFEKSLFFNELLSLTGFGILAYKRFKIGNEKLSLCIVLLLLLCSIHALTSIFRTSNFYYYFRNSVIFYSIFSYFAGYYCFPYLISFVNKIRRPLLLYSSWALLTSPTKMFFERFGASSIFPYLFKRLKRSSLIALILINIVYAISHDSSTAIIIAVFYLFLLLCPGFKFFKQVIIVGIISFALFFIYIQPNLNIIRVDFRLSNNEAIHNVMNSNPILRLDGNSTWRLVLWKQVIVDNFPSNLLGIGFGTPMFEYYPVEDISKVDSLPYVLGAHNSYIYLFGRLGLVYILLLIAIYTLIFKEYFTFTNYYYHSGEIAIFWSFFASSIVALLNPALESPIFAAGYWFMLGLLAATIYKHHNSIFLKSNS